VGHVLTRHSHTNTTPLAKKKTTHPHVHVLLVNMQFSSPEQLRVWCGEFRALAEKVYANEPHCLSYEVRATSSLTHSPHVHTYIHTHMHTYTHTHTYSHTHTLTHTHTHSLTHSLITHRSATTWRTARSSSSTSATPLASTSMVRTRPHYAHTKLPSRILLSLSLCHSLTTLSPTLAIWTGRVATHYSVTV
jgi:hypothetical protein